MFIMPICSLLLAAQPDSLIKDDDDPGDPTPSVVEPAPVSTSRPSPDDIPPVRPTDEIAPVRPDDEIAPMGGAVNAQPDVPPPGADGPLDGSDSPADSPAGEDYATLKPGCRFRYSYKCDTGTFHLTEKGGTAHYVMPDGRRNLVMLDRPSLGNPCRACRDNPAKEFDLPPLLREIHLLRPRSRLRRHLHLRVGLFPKPVRLQRPRGDEMHLRQVVPPLLGTP